VFLFISQWDCLALTEIEKINEYFAAARELKLNSPAGDSERSLYESWELRAKPLPFIVDAKSVELAGRKFKLPASGQATIGLFRWTQAEGCASFNLESGSEEWRLLLRFKDGEPSLSELEPSVQGDAAANYGGRLELVYDVIESLRRSAEPCEIASVSKKRFLEGVDAVASWHDQRLVKGLKGLSLADIRKLIADASADMAEDELSNQLSLALDGTYARESLHVADSVVRGSSLVHSRTRWEALLEMSYLASACRLKRDAEKAFSLPFKDAKLVGPLEPGGDLSLKIPIDADAPLSQGDILYVKLRGERTAFGTFRVDILDGDAVYGRLRGDSLEDAQSRLCDLSGTLPKSPSEFIASGMDGLRAALAGEGRLSPAQTAALGLKSFVLKPLDVDPAKRPAGLDGSQLHAWSAAVNYANPIVLVQGPPGTGKSFVLEQVLRSLCRQGLRVLAAAPSNTAVDNICRRLADMPVARFGKNPDSIAPDVLKRCWIGEKSAVDRFVLGRRRIGGGAVYAGTCVGLLRDQIVQDDMERNGRYDALVVDEAGMCAIDEFLLCAGLAKRAALFGDHQQLPPFPLPPSVETKLNSFFPQAPRFLRASLGVSALECLAEVRGLPVAMLQRSYRCQNPRLLRFSSTLFYDAVVKTSVEAEYYRLPYRERELRFPRATMRLYSTSSLPEELRAERLCVEGRKPGLENKAEAVVCASVFYESLRKYPLEEISIIAPYKRQVALLRETLSLEKARALRKDSVSDAQWESFLFSKVATVDSFQGGEGDVVIICYVRSNKADGIGFIDNPNRINVAHTRCRREMHIVGDIECLKRQAKNGVFERLERAFRRDGEIVELKELPALP